MRTLMIAGLITLLAAGSLNADEFQLPDATGYADALLSANQQEQEVGGLTVTVQTLADGYRYEMAKGVEELGKTGYTGTQAEKRVKKLHAKHKKLRGKVLFIVRIQKTGSQYTFATDPRLMKHVVLKVGSKSSKRVNLVQPKKLRPMSWEVFEHPPEHNRKHYRKALAEISDVLLHVTSVLLKTGSKETVTLGLTGLVSQSSTGAATDGINTRHRQLSCVNWSRLIHSDIAFTIYPGKLSAPAAPAGFDELLASLAK